MFRHRHNTEWGIKIDANGTILSADTVTCALSLAGLSHPNATNHHLR